MVIEELYVKNFGKLQDTKVALQEGLNLIYGPNESGKTTLHTFLKCMLFGMHRTKGQAAAKDVYSQYEPWEYSHYYAGSMRFSSGGRVFCLDRNFQKDDVKSKLLCETDGKELSETDLSMLLGNISEAVYDDTLSFGQERGVTNSDLALELKNCMANYQGTGDKELDLDKTMQILKDQKKAFEKEMQRKKAQEDSRKDEATTQLLYLREENQQLHRRIQLERQQLAQLEQQQKVQEDAASRKKSKKQVLKRRALELFMVGIAMFMAAAVLSLPDLWKAGAVAAGGVLEAGGLFFHWKMRKKMLAQREQQQEDQEMLARQIGRIQNRLRSQEETYQQKMEDQDALAQELHAYNPEIYQRDPLEEEIKGIDLAAEAIEAIGHRLQKEFGSRICDRTSKILAELTRGKYYRVAVDEGSRMEIASQERRVSLEQLSRGTMEQVSFALRMAMGDMLCDREPLPVVLDDVFAMYDEERLQETLQWLTAHKQQVLLFTCHKREQEILDACGIPYHRVAVFDS